jgi:hypothetical protein
MSLSLEENPMVWVVVQTVDGVEQFVGQHSADLDIMFIPFFEDKEEAQQGMSLIPRAKRAAVMKSRRFGFVNWPGMPPSMGFCFSRPMRMARSWTRSIRIQWSDILVSGGLTSPVKI